MLAYQYTRLDFYQKTPTTKKHRSYGPSSSFFSPTSSVVNKKEKKRERPSNSPETTGTKQSVLEIAFVSPDQYALSVKGRLDTTEIPIFLDQAFPYLLIILLCQGRKSNEWRSCDTPAGNGRKKKKKPTFPKLLYIGILAVLARKKKEKKKCKKTITFFSQRITILPI